MEQRQQQETQTEQASPWLEQAKDVFYNTPRGQAQEALETKELDFVGPLLEALQKEGLRQRRRRIRITIGVSTYILFMLFVAITTRHFGGMGGIGGMTGLLISAAAATQQQKGMVRSLAQFDDIRIVGPLAELLEMLDADTGAVAEGALVRLLPRLQASDAAKPFTAQRQALYRALKRKNAALVTAILKALEQIGDYQALPYVEKLLEGEGQAAKDPQVQEAARECLPFLQQLAQQEQARQTLLRAAAATPETHSETLLRPASGVPTVDPEQLLRAGIGNEE